MFKVGVRVVEVAPRTGRISQLAKLCLFKTKSIATCMATMF